MPTLTPDNLVHWLLLGMYWEPEGPQVRVVRFGRTRSEPKRTTVGHVLEVLRRLDIITTIQIKTIQHADKGQIYQRRLYLHCGIVRDGNDCPSSNPGFWFLCREGRMGHMINLSNLVSEKRIWISDAGIEQAPLFEEMHHRVLSKERYLAEVAKMAQEEQMED